MRKDSIAIDIDEDYIKILHGNRKKIKNYDLVRTPKKSIIDDKIINIEPIKDVIKNYTKTNNLKKMNVSFSIHGQDIIVRHVEIPLMEEKKIKESIDWEIKQYLPDYGDNHYIDFEIIEKINTVNEKIFKILVVAVPKEKVDILYRISKELDLKLTAVDLSANSITRVFNNIKNIENHSNNGGIIHIGSSTSILMVLEKGKLVIEREIPIGLFSFLGEISNNQALENGEAYEYITKRFNINYINENIDKEKRLYEKVDSLCESYSKIIQFYTNGKTTKTINNIYITGNGNSINGLEQYAANYFNTSVSIVNTAVPFELTIELPKDLDFKNFVSCIGLLLRRE